MDFEISGLEPKITKELLLSKNSEETYMQTYLGVPVKKGLLISPLRKDIRPTASFYRNKKGELIFHDFGTGFHNNFIGVVMYLNNCSYGRALNIIAEDFGIIEKTSERPPIKIRTTTEKISDKIQTLIQIENQEFSEIELNWWKSFGINKETLDKYKVFSCKSIFLNGNFFTYSSQNNLIFGYYGGKRDNQELWRIYFPQKRSYRFLSNWDKYLVQGAKQLPQEGENLIIVKSMKDTMLLNQNGFSACAPCSENILMSKNQMNRLKLKFKNIYLFWDNDDPGITAANKYKEVYPFLKSIRLKPEFAKDISDLYKYKGITHFNKAKEELSNIFKDTNLTETDHFIIT